MLGFVLVDLVRFEFGLRLLTATEISPIDLRQDGPKYRQQRWEVFRNRRPDDTEIDIEIRVDQSVSH